jgi:hypothetical protein
MIRKADSVTTIVIASLAEPIDALRKIAPANATASAIKLIDLEGP